MKKLNGMNMAKVLAVPALVLALASCAAIDGQETAGEYIDDATVTAQVKKAYLVDPQIKSFQIHVETMEGVVQLSGFVDSASNEQRAVQLAEKVDGVKLVKDNLVVVPPK